MKSSLLIVILLAGLAAFAQPAKRWDKTFGGSEDDEMRAIAPLPDGGFLIGGSSVSPVGGDRTAPGLGGSDYWVVRIDAEGNKLWDKAYGGKGQDVLYSILALPDGGCLLGGESAADFWIVRLDADGVQLWDKAIGGDNLDMLTSMLHLPDGGFLLGGLSLSEVGRDKTAPSWDLPDNFAGDMWIVRVDALGNKLWDNAFGGTADDYLWAMAPATDGGFLLGGMSFSEASGDKTAPRRSDEAADDFWVVRIDVDGKKLWDRTFGGDFLDELAAVVPTPDNGFLLAGFTSSTDSTGNKTDPGYGGGSDCWVIRLDADGEKLWGKCIGGLRSDALGACIPTPDGGFLLGCTSNSGIGFDKSEPYVGEIDYWVVRIDADGEKLWDKTLGAGKENIVTALAYLADGGIIVGGGSNSGPGGAKSDTNRGRSDFWVVRLDSERALWTVTPDTLTPQAYCPGDTVQVSFTTTLPFGKENVFVAELSDAKGSFDAPKVLGQVAGRRSSRLTAILPDDLAPSTAYRLRVAATRLAVVGSDAALTVKAMPSKPMVTRAGTHLTSSAPAGNQWYDAQGLIPGATDSIFTPNREGTYYVVVTLDGCLATSEPIEFVGRPETSWRLGVAPNPSNGRFRIRTPWPCRLTACNSLGQSVAAMDCFDEAYPDWSHLPAGVYLLRAEAPGHPPLTKRLIFGAP